MPVTKISNLFSIDLQLAIFQQSLDKVCRLIIAHADILENNLLVGTFTILSQATTRAYVQNGVAAILLSEDKVIDIVFILLLQEIGQIQLVGLVINTELTKRKVHDPIFSGNIRRSFVTKLPAEGVRSCTANQDIIAGSAYDQV